MAQNRPITTTRKGAASPPHPLQSSCNTTVNTLLDYLAQRWRSQSFSPDTPPNHSALALRTQRTHPPPPKLQPLTRTPPTSPSGISYDPPPLPSPRAPRARNPLIRLVTVLRSLSEITSLPTPTSPSHLTRSTLKPVLILMKSHAAPNSAPKPLFYPEGTPTPLATSQTPKHSPNPFPPSPAASRPHTPSNR